MNEYPDPVATRPIWLVTLADLALLMVGFFVLLQATQHIDRTALATGLRAGFDARAAPPPPAMPVAATGMRDFAPGSAALPGATNEIVRWAADAVRDPRVTLTVTGSVDGTAADVDPATQSGAILATDRARAVAAAIARVAPGRIAIATNPHAGPRAAIITLAFTGEAKEPS